MRKSKTRLRRILYIALSALCLTIWLPQPVAYAYSFTNESILTASDGATQDQFGQSVSISGDYAIVGTAYAAAGGLTAAGKAYIYHWNGTSWEQQQILTASDKAAKDYFGYSVSISGDYAIVGAHNADPGAVSMAGKTYIFHNNGTSWVQQQILTASDKAEGARFGLTVSISGNYALVDAPYADPGGITDAGEAYIFYYNGTSWVQQQILTASDKADSDFFGMGLCISGDYAFLGTSGADTEGLTAAGKAYVFHNNGTSWVQQQILTASDKAANGAFGGDVCISGDDAIVSGANQKYYIFHDNGTSWEQEQLIDLPGSYAGRVSISGDFAAMGIPSATVEGLTYVGHVFFYHDNGTSWVQQQILTASDKAEDDQFGYSVSISGEKLLVGANYADVEGLSLAGKAYMYDLVASTYAVNYDANGGSGTMEASSGVEETDITLSANTFTRAGYLFAGWSSTSGGAAEYADGADYTIPASNSTLYAVWTSSAPELGFIPGSEFWITTFSDKNYKDAGDTSDEVTYTAIRFGEYVNIKADEFKAQMIVTGGSVKLFDGSNTDITDSTSAYIGSTCTVALYDTLNNLTKTYLVTLKGDVNGDGYILTPDVVLLRKYTVNTSALTIAQKYAGDINKDGYVLTPDVVALRKFTVNTGTIDQTN